MLRKRQIRILTTQLPLNEMTSDDSIDNRLTRLTEEDNGNLYDIIDESTTSKTFEASTIKTKNYNSYLDVTYSENTSTNVKDNVGIICLAHDSTQPQSVQKKKSQRSCLDESVFSGEHGQGVLGCAYSDGYLRPMSIANQNVISKTMEKQGKCLSNKDREAQREYDEHIYDELDYDGIERSAIYDRLYSVKGTSSAINGYMFVRSPTDTEQLGINETMFAEQLGINIQKHSKYTTCSSKRKSI
ncbi:unnamed protein product [Mytilus edulis]|uniref:Uncharacterized protein n=1 Tax=Mytilus edulis TaxID=6550 RepID=A0A8S3RX97_MYTED|nr:unnamed protein product [Mytilus edulis]